MQENYDLAKWLQDEMTDVELEAFKKTPEYSDYAKIKMYSSQLQAPSFDENLLFERIKSNKHKQRKVIPLYKTFIKIAAAIAVILCLAFAVKSFVPTSEYAHNGQRTSVILPDNSHVTLNSGSEIAYKKWKWSYDRKVTLTGEAFFKVAKGETFDVITDLGKVTVLGTQFNVKARGSRLDVCCFEGKVQVNYQNQQLVIEQGQSVAFENGSPMDIPQHIKSTPHWINNEVGFTNEPLINVLTELERQYNVSIELKTEPASQLFTGVLPAKNLDACLKILASVYHLESVRVNQNKIILKAVDEQQ